VRIECRDLRKSFYRKAVLRGVDLSIDAGESIVIMGRSGCGKSVLLKHIVGLLEPDQGEVRIGASVKMGYFAQHAMELLDPNLTVLETIERAHPKASGGRLRTLLGAFGFPKDDVEKPCSVLSGGEKARVVMAQMLYDPPNLLVLDEPTNHLDIQTKEMLVNALKDFEGTMLFVSHDRQFLRALSNRVLELTKDGVHTYGGGYSEYVAQSGHEAPTMVA